MSKMMIYSGIGSRSTPKEIGNLMTLLATKLDLLGYTLRSGHATGSDTYFENGVISNKKEIYLAKDATTESIEYASKFHDKWSSCKDYVKCLHGRNVKIILGKDLKSPSDFVICWTEDETNGGTSLGLKIAKYNQIPIFNLANEEHKERLLKFINT